MNFKLTEEQRLIIETVSDFLSHYSDSEQIRMAMEMECGWDGKLWRKICTELGLQAVHLPESVGGMGLGYEDLVIVMEQCGVHLLCSPMLSSICLAANAILLVADDQQQNRWLELLCSGEQTAALGWCTQDSRRWDAAGTPLIVKRAGDEFILNGRLGHIVDGFSADLLVVAAKTGNSESKCDQLSLFAVPADTAGLCRQPYPTMDMTRRQCELIFDNTVVGQDTLLGSFGEAAEKLDNALALATIALAAEQSGCARRCLDLTVSYTGERRQFGRQIASFQAVKHKCADLLVTVESMRSAAWYAGCVAQSFLQHKCSADTLHQAAALAGSRCGDGLFHCAAEALQLHGGVGFTWEYDIHLYLKRALSSVQLLGTPHWHRQRLAEWVLDECSL